MKIVNFENLYYLDYDLEKVFAMKQFWKDKEEFKHTKPRLTSAFLYMKSCGAEYKEEGKETEILSSLSYTKKLSEIYKNRFSSIVEGIMYMENDAKQFKKQTGLSPKEYRGKKRVQ